MMKLELWEQCEECKGYFDKIGCRGLCPSPKCSGIREARRRAVGDDPWHQCINCRHWYQAPKALSQCQACQAKHDANLARDRAQLEAMKGTVGG